MLKDKVVFLMHQKNMNQKDLAAASGLSEPGISHIVNGNRTDVKGSTLAITIFTCVMVWRSGDLSPLPVLITVAFAELAVGTAFYYNKAKVENKIKLKKQYGEIPEEEEPIHD